MGPRRCRRRVSCPCFRRAPHGRCDWPLPFSFNVNSLFFVCLLLTSVKLFVGCLFSSSGSLWLSFCSPAPARWARRLGPVPVAVFPVFDQQDFKVLEALEFKWETSFGIFQLFSDKPVFNGSHCAGDSLLTVQPIIPPR